MLFLVVGFISLVDKIQFMLISSQHFCISLNDSYLINFKNKFVQDISLGHKGLTRVISISFQFSVILAVIFFLQLALGVFIFVFQDKVQSYLLCLLVFPSLLF